MPTIQRSGPYGADLDELIQRHLMGDAQYTTLELQVIILHEQQHLHRLASSLLNKMFRTERLTQPITEARQ